MNINCVKLYLPLSTTNIKIVSYHLQYNFVSLYVMDKKQEKYYSYVVEDLVSKTEIDYDQEIIKFPFSFASFFLPFSSLPFIPLSPYFSFAFSSYLLGRYAINEGLSELWGLYINKIKNKVDTYSK